MEAISQSQREWSPVKNRLEVVCGGLDSLDQIHQAEVAGGGEGEVSALFYVPSQDGRAVAHCAELRGAIEKGMDGSCYFRSAGQLIRMPLFGEGPSTNSDMMLTLWRGMSAGPDGGPESPPEPSVQSRLPSLPEYALTMTGQHEQGVVSTLARLPSWASASGNRGCTVSGASNRFAATVSVSDALWESIKRLPLYVLKVWFAIEAHRLQRPDPSATFVVSVNQLAKITNRMKGDWVPRPTKRQIEREVMALVNAEWRFEWYNHAGKMLVASGPLYYRSATWSEGDANTEAVPSFIVLQRNNGIYATAEDEALGKYDFLPTALLSLSLSTDKAAFVLGAYVVTKARAQSLTFEPGEARFRVCRVVQELVETGVMQPVEAYQRKRMASHVKGIVQKALDKLVQVGCIQSWGVTVGELDARALPFSDWFNGTISVRLNKRSAEKQIQTRKSGGGQKARPHR